MSARRDALLDEIALREASLADVRREFAAGDLDAASLEDLVATESAALQRCRDELAGLAEDADRVASATPVVRSHRRRYLGVALTCFLAATVVVLVSALSPRQPGSSVTGGISTATAGRIAQLLADGEIDQATGNQTAALSAYDQVLQLDAHNVEALTQSGWLSFSAGTADHDVLLVTTGETRVGEAVAYGPRDPGARLYYAIIAASTPSRRAFAAHQFRIFLRLKPSATLRAVARPWLVELGLISSQ